MKKVLFIAAMLLVVALMAAPPMTADAEDLSASQVKILESTGVPIHPSARYTTGDSEGPQMFWFRSKESPDKIMDWYKGKLSGWSEMTVNGMRVIYKGPSGIGSKELSAHPYIFTRTTDESGVSSDSEITVRIPK